MALIAGSARLWTGGIVPFSIDIDVSAAESGLIATAIGLFSGTGVQLVPHNRESSYIHFAVYPDPKDKFGSDSSIGKVGGPQMIWLGFGIPSGIPTGSASIAHEICHALGLLHEQNRGDRDSFVTINWSNINPIHHDQFKAQPSQNATDFGSYDKFSIMHYQRHAYAINPSIDTITPLVPPPGPAGDFSGSGPTAGDIAAINSRYPPSLPMGESSDTGPALAVKGNTILLAWKGNGNNSLATMTSSTGQSFSGKTTLNDQSGNAPALSVLRDKFVIAWTGVENNKLNVMQSNDGVSWQDKITLSDFSPSSPALAQVGAELFLSWRGGDDHLNLRRSPDGIHWLPKTTISETSSSGPALSSAGPTLLLAWRGRGGNNLNVMRGPGGFLPGSKVTLGDTTDDRPALCTNGLRAFLAWRGTGNGFMNVMRSDDGANWGARMTVNTDQMLGGPAIAHWDGILVRCWTELAAGNALRARTFPQF
jgi:hypothetical protein